jgi:6-pyruvoyltetrahydropterin/6-carboxytetrahydropterin synthase
MLDLTRSVRLCINDAPPTSPPLAAPADNTFAAYPSPRGLARFYELQVRCRGDVNPATGYFINIKDIDQAVRAAALPIIADACRVQPSTDPALVLSRFLEPLSAALHNAVASVRWAITPYYSIEMTPTRPDRVLLRQQFEFAASHRLHCAHLSEADNRALFGKCNHPGGHGHNYRVEPCIDSPLSENGSAVTLAQIEHLTARAIIDRFDHKNLNADCPEFDASRGGVNPSVENIAKVCFDRLAPEIAKAAPNARLSHITVWETDKTCCTYPAETQ